MLVMQACLANGKFFGADVDFARAGEIYAALRAERLNLVLVGMPGSGKTTLGKALAKKMRRPFVDCDAEIERVAGMSIPEIFRTRGEEAFRALESEVIERYGKESGQVIATGGGAPLRARNVTALRQNGMALLVRRPLELLATAGRPLSAGGMETVRRLEAERATAYSACADARVDNSDTVARAVDEALSAFPRLRRHLKGMRLFSLPWRRFCQFLMRTRLRTAACRRIFARGGGTLANMEPLRPAKRAGTENRAAYIL